MPPDKKARSLWALLAALVLSAFALNWLWEMLQMPAFVALAGRSWAETAFPWVRPAVGDVAMTVGIYGLGALAAGNRRWGPEGVGLWPLRQLVLLVPVSWAFTRWWTLKTGDAGDRHAQKG